MEQRLDVAFVLHSRPYSDSRLLLDLFVEAQGRLSAIARRPKRGTPGASFSPFQEVVVDLRGRHELKTLNSCEPVAGGAHRLVGERLFCGLYLNELVQRLLPPCDPHDELFAAYRQCLAELAGYRFPSDRVPPDRVPPDRVSPDRVSPDRVSPDRVSQDRVPQDRDEAERALRRFESACLASLGFDFDYFTCQTTGEAIAPDACYELKPGEGFAVTAQPIAPQYGRFAGRDILAFGRGQLDSDSALRSAKFIARFALAPMVGDKPFKSRELFS